MDKCLSDSMLLEQKLLIKEVRYKEVVVEYKLSHSSTTLTIPRWCFYIPVDRKIFSLYAEDIDGEVNSYILNLDEVLKMFIDSSEDGESVEYSVGLPLGENVTRMTWYDDVLSIVNSFGPAKLSIVYIDKDNWINDNGPALEITFEGHSSPLYISMLLLDNYYNNPDSKTQKWLISRKGDYITRVSISSDIYDLILSYYRYVSRLNGHDYYLIQDIEPERDKLFFEYTNKWTSDK